MKILIFSPPFAGHYNVLFDLVKSHPEHEFKMVFTTWENMETEGHLNLVSGELTEASPALWTFPRVARLLDKILKVTKEFEPDLILYDFFSLEGFFAGKKLGIPAWSSIGTFLGPNDNQQVIKGLNESEEVLASIKRIQEIVPFDLNEIETIADGIHLPGECNLVWSYKDLVGDDFKVNRNTKKIYKFLGNHTKKHNGTGDRILISFGTVVMGNLWDKVPSITRGIREFISGLSLALKNEKVTFVTQGREVLDSYPSTWRIVDRINQKRELSDTELFITHGGCNSFHESIKQTVPMIVIPFFGDQSLIAKVVEKKGLGFSLIKEARYNDYSGAFLSRELAHSAFEHINTIRDQKEMIIQNFKNLDLTTDSIF